jgi:hypothetical protein
MASLCIVSWLGFIFLFPQDLRMRYEAARDEYSTTTITTSASNDSETDSEATTTVPETGSENTYTVPGLFYSLFLLFVCLIDCLFVCLFVICIAPNSFFSIFSPHHSYLFFSRF